eukprot:NODE_583_length_6431_cov_0.491788.p4 type:complete len:171 gc:universal NODE_583_length_6431_cov_0.491788:908-396(-)
MTLNMPNILVCGTPGVGKSTLCQLLKKKLEMKYLGISELVVKNKLHDGYDSLYDTYIVNDDKIIDFIHEDMVKGGCIVDSHIVDIFPDDYFDLVIVLRCDNSILHDRMTKRSYSALKITENITAEIMQVILEEARELFPEVKELNSNSKDDQNKNIDYVMNWVANFNKNE